MAVGIVGVLIAGLQPQLLGSLEQEGRVGPMLLGIIASAELLAMGIGAGIAGLMFDRAPLRLVTLAATVLLIASDLATSVVPGVAIVVARMMAGTSEGVLIGVTIGFVVRTTHPARWSGVYLATQTLAQFALATALGLWIVPIAGAAGGFRALAVVSMIGLVAIPWLPRRFSPLTRDDGNGRVPPRGWLALSGVLLYLAFIVAAWVYVEPLARAQGIGGRTLALIAPLSLVMQVAGAGVATLIADRIRAAPMIGAAVAANLIVLAVMGAPVGPTLFLIATSAFGFLWLFAMPFQIPLVIAADPSRRAASLIGGAQLIGSSAGPFAAGLIVGDGRVSVVLWLSGVCALLALATLIGAGMRRTLSRIPQAIGGR